MPQGDWTVVFYLDSMSPEDNPKDQDLASYVRLHRTKIKEAHKNSNPGHVAYRAVYRGRDGAPYAEEYSDGSLSSQSNVQWTTQDLSEDIGNFLMRTFDRYRTQHRAIFFYGHTFGPAGLFEKEEHIVPAMTRDPNSPTHVAVTTLRKKLAASLPHDDSHGRSTVDIVLFADCLMSTLETAYELRGLVRNVIASQSAVPAGISWPYENMFSNLSQQMPERQLLDDLVGSKGLYRKTTNLGPCQTVQFSLLRPSMTAEVTPKLNVLVKRIRSDYANLQRRHRLVAPAAISHAPTREQKAPVGDPALVDLLSLCLACQSSAQTPELQAAGRNLQRILAGADGLVVHQSECVRPRQRPFGFRGISAFYAGDLGYPYSSIFRDFMTPEFYHDLAVKESLWPQFAYDGD